MKQIFKQFFNRLSEDFNQRIHYSTKSRYLIYLSFFLLFFVVVLLHNLHLFTTSIFETGDYAANSILINLAKSLQLFVGNYSRMGFSHPGPAFLYVMAFFEEIFYNCLHLVPSPFNAQVIGIFFLNSFFIAICCYIFFDITKSITKTIPVIALILFYYAINPVLLYSTWMPHIYFAPFFAFILSASVIAAKRSSFLWVMILSGMFLIHGHVAFLFMVPPVALLSLILCLSQYDFNIRKFVRDNKITVILSVGIVVLFALPIIINTIINYPGEFGKYLHYTGQSHQSPAIGSLLMFFLPFWSVVVTSVQFPSVFPQYTSNALAGSISVILICGISILIYCHTPEKDLKRLFRNTGIIVIVISALFLFYILRGIDELAPINHYTGIFFYAVPLILLCLIITFAISKITSHKIISLILIVSFVSIGISVSMGNFTNPERGSPYIQEIITKLHSDSRWNNETIVLEFPHKAWPIVTGLVVASERSGNPIYVDSNWEFMFTKYHMLKNSPDPTKKIWHLILTYAKMGNKSVIYSNPQFLLIDEAETTILPGDGFYEDENWNTGSYFTWMNERGEIYIFSQGYTKSVLTFEATSFNKSRRLLISINNSIIYQNEIPSSNFINVTIPVTLVNGQNMISLVVPDGSEKPVDISTLHNPDSRNLSIAFRNLTIYSYY